MKTITIVHIIDPELNFTEDPFWTFAKNSILTTFTARAWRNRAAHNFSRLPALRLYYLRVVSSNRGARNIYALVLYKEKKTIEVIETNPTLS